MSTKQYDIKTMIQLQLQSDMLTKDIASREKDLRKRKQNLEKITSKLENKRKAVGDIECLVARKRKKPSVPDVKVVELYEELVQKAKSADPLASDVDESLTVEGGVSGKTLQKLRVSQTKKSLKIKKSLMEGSHPNFFNRLFAAHVDDDDTAV